ncbi:hypothetical protein NC652_039796 [Populus alba x Populus x berolinensis]|nr:hypothetical protein NC652_039796 [Populus alba x Populus x berolinensis]
MAKMGSHKGAPAVHGKGFIWTSSRVPRVPSWLVSMEHRPITHSHNGRVSRACWSSSIVWAHVDSTRGPPVHARRSPSFFFFFM